MGMRYASPLPITRMSTDGVRFYYVSALFIFFAQWLNDAAAYSSDAVYLYSTLDSPQDQARSPPAVLPPNRRSRTPSSADTSEDRSPMTGTSVTNDMMEADIDRYLDEEDRQGAIEGGEDDENTTDNEDADDEGDDENDSTTQKFHPNVPLVYPRGRYIGACNVETVKDGKHTLTSIVLALTCASSKLSWSQR